MRIVDLDDAVTSAAEVLSQALSHPNRLQDSCTDLAPEEVCKYALDLVELSRLASHLAELALDTLTED